jgi:hypothetical protein
MPIAEDPGTLRHVAARLRMDADEICADIARVASATVGFVYEGPAAARFFDTIHRSRTTAHSEAQRLYDLARRLDALAYDAEERIRMELLA